MTPLGKSQAASLAPQLSKIHDKIDLVISSPLQRTLQTTKLGWAPAIERLGIQNVICLPEAQECNAFPCDTGSPKEILAAKSEFAGFDFSRLKPEWTSKQGFWAPEAKLARGRWVRQFLRERPERNIVLVAHGDILRCITANEGGESTYMWKNAEVREFVFDPKSVEGDECFLIQEEDVAAAGGYAPGSSEMDVVAGNGKL